MDNIPTDSEPANGFSIIYSPPFTFLVGPKHTKLTIQRGLAQHVSKPLDELMNNGTSRESKHGIAILEEEDVETFVAFCEYAYRGEYTVPALPDEYGGGGSSRPGPSPWKGIIRTDSMSTTVPPPAPTPPRSVGTPAKEDHPHHYHQRQSSLEYTKFPGEEAPVVVPDPTQAGAEEALAPEDPLEVSTPVVDDTEKEKAPGADEDADAWGMEAGSSAPKSKKGKKSKKDKKKGKGVATETSMEDLASNLTPPTTPPPETSQDALEDMPEQAFIDTTETAGPADMSDSWQQASPTPPELETAWPDEPSGGEGSGEAAPAEEIEESPQQQLSRQPALQPKGVNLWGEFAGLAYADQRPSYRHQNRSSLALRSTGELPYLVFHAKVYVFATKYLIPALAQLCLQKLHSDLLHLSFPDSENNDDEFISSLTSAKARMILDLLHYTYTKTTRLEPISPTSATQLRDNELRRLVTHYAACKIRDLAQYCPSMESVLGSPTGPKEEKISAGKKGLRNLLDTTTELASDLVYRMM
ncbi:hypothetical protein ASPZODRAFT_67283 [Penicilliopsis zonata CBS 506.65]|uniref:BTB domain-containing protein n=1 Tax=Penicilliopsis zonata CBS 506.65 TaxID=1073090 RepID=A0A1L9SG85_9EURO|nr:hypothetical protein ASPZODRAFT_67283 [Penicilliopsis zonata CBS 506.65]OJJ46250.1 hypothetical protein ASPZODRAFT_67283 [Penicilliopsis zonata CBS 506.65]